MSAPWLKFYPSDWRSDPALRMCSLGARALWLEMLCTMSDASPCGSLHVKSDKFSIKQLADLVGATAKKVVAHLKELETAGVFDRDYAGVIYSRAERLGWQEWIDLRRSIFERDEYLCRYCGSGDRLECDHVVPFSRGGTDDPDNLVAACFSCNRSKGSKLLEEWLN